MQKRRVIFRITPTNRLSFPVLLNAWESHQMDRHFEIIIRETPLTSEPFQEIQKGDVVLFSFLTPHLPLIHEEIMSLKGTGAIVAGGGPHITYEQELILEMGFQVLFIGPGETNFLAFGRDLLEHNLEKTKIYPYPTPETNISDLNTYLPITTYMRGTPPLEIMRGCAWNCNYCATGLQKAIYRNLESIKHFLDLTSTASKRIYRVNFICPSAMEYQAPNGVGRKHEKSLAKIEEILRLTRSYGFKYIEYGIFPSEIRPDTVSSEAINTLKQYVSHKYVTLGAQSGSNQRLKELRRAHTVEDIERAVAIINDSGIMAYLDFIIAYPGETPAERRETLHFIKTLHKKYRVRTQLHYFFPLPGSTYGFRFPAMLTEEEKAALRELKKSGISRDGWVENEKQMIQYFKWLKQNFPTYYSRYEGAQRNFAS
jgi:B12-binding domain/radical SAM domain protein